MTKEKKPYLFQYVRVLCFYLYPGLSLFLQSRMLIKIKVVQKHLDLKFKFTTSKISLSGFCKANPGFLATTSTHLVFITLVGIILYPIKVWVGIPKV